PVPPEFAGWALHRAVRPTRPGVPQSLVSARRVPIPGFDRPAGFRGSAGYRAAARFRRVRASAPSGPPQAYISGPRSGPERRCSWASPSTSATAPLCRARDPRKKSPRDPPVHQSFLEIHLKSDSTAAEVRHLRKGCQQTRRFDRAQRGGIEIKVAEMLGPDGIHVLEILNRLDEADRRSPL